MERFSQFMIKSTEKDKISQINEYLKAKPVFLDGKLGVYKLLSYLGGGTYGDVFKALLLSANQHFAIKILAKTSSNLRELKAYARLEQCNNYTVCVYETFSITVSGQDWSVVVQQLFDDDLSSYKPQAKELSGMLIDLLFGLSCIHELDLAHMDIKGQNMFTVKTSTGRQYKIGDPGLMCGESPIYKAGELSDCSLFGTFIPLDTLRTYGLDQEIPLKVAQSVDMWALGVFFVTKLRELGIIPIETAQPFMDTTFINAENGTYPEEQLLKILSNLKDYFNDKTLPVDTFGSIYSFVFMGAIQAMLAFPDKLRITASDLLIYIVTIMGWAEQEKALKYLQSIQRKQGCPKQYKKLAKVIRTGRANNVVNSRNIVNNRKF